MIAKAFPSLCKKDVIMHINYLALNRASSSPIFFFFFSSICDMVDDGCLQGRMTDGGQHV